MKKPPDDIARRLIEVSDQLGGTGFDVTVDDVAKMCDVPRATLYYYFSGKDDLVAFFLNYKLESVRDALSTAASIDGTLEERLESALRAFLQAIAEHPTLCTDLPIAVHQAGAFEEVAARMESVVLTPLRELLIEGRATGEFRLHDADIVAAALLGGLMQAAFMRYARLGEIDATALGDELVPVLLHGLALKEPAATR